MNVIELPSLANKRDGRIACLDKRERLRHGGVNVVEIDLVRGGDPVTLVPGRWRCEWLEEGKRLDNRRGGAIISVMIATAKSSSPCEPVSAHFENGDMLTLSEFLRRYEGMPHVKKAELIEGIVHMASPVRVTRHSKPDGLMQGWLFAYAAAHDLEVLPNTTLLLDPENCFQPDAILCSQPREGGRVWLNKKDYLCGSPELVVEIAASSVSIDLRDKLKVYRRAEVAEYIVWRTEDAEIDWFMLEDGHYVKQPADKNGKIRSRIFKGLTLDVKAALAFNKTKVLASLR